MRKIYYFSPKVICDDLGQYVQNFLKFYLKKLSDKLPLSLYCSLCGVRSGTY